MINELEKLMRVISNLIRHDGVRSFNLPDEFVEVGESILAVSDYIPGIEKITVDKCKDYAERYFKEAEEYSKPCSAHGLDACSRSSISRSKGSTRWGRFYEALSKTIYEQDISIIKTTVQRDNEEIMKMWKQ